MSHDDWHVYTSTSLLLLSMMMLTVMRMSVMLAQRFLELLMLAAYCNAVDVYRYWYDKPRRFPAVVRRRRPDAACRAGVVAGAAADSARQ